MFNRSFIRRVSVSVVFVAACATLLLLQVGFQKPAVVVKVPTGEWVGEGQYVYETWPRQPGGDVAPISTTSRYPTRLSIRADKAEGHDVLVFDILSQHKEVGVLKDDIHLVLAFEEAKRLSDSALLYRMVSQDMNPSEGKVIDYDENAPACSASLIREGDDLIFTVRYDENFSEAFRFHGGTLQKSGLIAPGEDDSEQGFIHWVETLKRK